MPTTSSSTGGLRVLVQNNLSDDKVGHDPDLVCVETQSFIHFLNFKISTIVCIGIIRTLFSSGRVRITRVSVFEYHMYSTVVV